MTNIRFEFDSYGVNKTRKCFLDCEMQLRNFICVKLPVSMATKLPTIILKGCSALETVRN
jgi:hypothetical protein